MIPARSLTKIAAITLPPSEFEVTFEEVGAHYVEKVFDHVGYKFDLRLCLFSLPGKHVISTSDIFEDLDFTRENLPEEEHEIYLQIQIPSILNGFIVWLNLYLDNEEVIDSLGEKYIWLPLYLPVFPGGEAVKKGDYIRAKISRKLSENRINPDFTLRGQLYKSKSKPIDFVYHCPHVNKEFKGNAFYKEIFSRDKLKITNKISTRDLRRFLSSELPEYMVPSYFVQLEKIPLTVSGKLDWKALPEPDAAPATVKYVPPGSEIEKKLTDVWQEVLGISRIGTTDNFFEVGGDSIKAIQVVARLKKYNLDLKINDIFLHPVIKELGKYVKGTHRVIHQGIVEGEVELTPIQRCFWDYNFTGKHHFNQTVMLYRETGFDEKILKEVFTKIVEHHDALRMVYDYRENTGKVIQRNRGIEGKLFDFEIIRLEDTRDNDIAKAIEKEANRIQQGINLKTGPLVKLGLFKTSRDDHLLIVVHHLVVDGISWRILIEDISIGYKQSEQGEEIKFQEKTDSYLTWSQKLIEYASGASPGGKSVLKELNYWKKIEAENPLPLPRDYEIPREKKKIKYLESLRVNLEKEETELLLRSVNQVYNTEINDILLTALALAVNQWSHWQKVLIELEGHGRESVIKDIDINRTVGWFTTRFPVVLDMSRAENISYIIRSVKETLRRIPNKGIGYGLLKYLTPREKKEDLCFKLEPEIIFNYLGQFGQENDEHSGNQDRNQFIQMSPLSGGESFNPRLDQIHALEINGMMVDGCLSFSFTYNKYEYDRDRIEKLSDLYKLSISRIIQHCINRGKSELTPSDTGYTGIDIEDFEQWEKEISDFD
jgi:tyrocidine synthetase-3